MVDTVLDLKSKPERRNERGSGERVRFGNCVGEVFRLALSLKRVVPRDWKRKKKIKDLHHYYYHLDSAVALNQKMALVSKEVKDI